MWPSKLDRQWFDGFVIAALVLLPKLVDFPAAARVDFAAAATLGYFLVLQDVGYVTKRINCSTLSARMPNIKWQSTLA
jgi:hypothetical protein